MLFTPFPTSLSHGLGKNADRAGMHGAMLDLDHLRALIDNGEEEALCRDWLHREEQAKLNALHYPKRHLEWLGGRICAKQAALHYLEQGLASAGQHSTLSPRARSAAMRAPQLQIKTATSGRPFLDHSILPGRMARLTTPHISISHSKGYAMAVAAATLCGLDIQAASDALGRVKDRFCSRQEEELLGHTLTGLQDTDHLTLLWAAKEAVKKGAAMALMPGFLDLTLAHIQADTPADGRTHFLFTVDYQEHRHQSLSLQPPLLQFQVTVCLHQGYGIGLCLLPPHLSPGDDNA